MRTTTKGHAMNGKAILAAIATGAAGLAAAFALTVAPRASAATVDQLPGLGYSVTVTNLCSGFPCVANGCHDYSVTGYGASVDLGSDCDPVFQQNLDSFVAGHDERKLAYVYPAAIAARADITGKGYTVATSYDVPTFTVTGGCGINSTVDAAGIVTLDAALPAAAPCPTTTTTATPTTTTAPTDTAPGAPAPQTTTTDTPTPDTATEIADLYAQLKALQAQYDALSSRVDSIEQANAASWQAFSDALEAGDDAATAALAARSAGLNAAHGLS